MKRGMVTTTVAAKILGVDTHTLRLWHKTGRFLADTRSGKGSWHYYRMSRLKSLDAEALREKRSVPIQPMQPSSELNRAYLAGIIDGEGTLTIFKVRDPNGKSRYSYRPVLRICSTSVHLLDWITANFGGGVRKQHTRTRNPKHNPVYCVEFHARMLRNLVPQLLDMLIVKQTQAQILMEFLERHCRGQGRGSRQRNANFYEGCYSRIHALNRRGVPQNTP